MDRHLQIGNISLLIRLPSGEIIRHFDQQWKPWLVPEAALRPAVRIVVKRTKRGMRELLRTFLRKRSLSFSTSSSSLTRMTQDPRKGWVAESLAGSRLSPHQVYFGVVEPSLHHLLQRMNTFALHGAGVAKQDASVLILGESGAGKSTTAALFLLHGFRVVSDDDVIVSLRGTKIKALGSEEGISIYRESLDLFSDFKALDGRRWVRRGKRIKKMLYPREEENGVRRPESASVGLVIFPEVRSDAPTRLIRLNKRQALIQLLRQRPNTRGFYLQDDFAAGRLFRFYEALSTQADCYRLILGKDHDGIRKKIRQLVQTINLNGGGI